MKLLTKNITNIKRTTYILMVLALAQLKLYATDVKIGNQIINLKIARDKQELKTGLMFVKKLPKNQGMLFIYPKNRQPRIWMKNTFIPLDIIFLDKDKGVTCLHENAKPFDTKNIIKCDKKSAYVIELNSGSIKRLKIKPGDKIDFKL